MGRGEEEMEREGRKNEKGKREGREKAEGVIKTVI